MPHQYFWIVAENQGRQILLAGGNTYTEAQRKALEELDSDFEVVMFPTKDIGSASHMLKERNPNTLYERNLCI